MGLCSNSWWQLSCCGHYPPADLLSFIIHSAHFPKIQIQLEVYCLSLQQGHVLNQDALTFTWGNIIKLGKKFQYLDITANLKLFQSLNYPLSFLFKDMVQSFPRDLQLPPYCTGKQDKPWPTSPYLFFHSLFSPVLPHSSSPHSYTFSLLHFWCLFLD